MAEASWKRAQRRICRQWGAEAAWRGEPGADDKDASAPVSLEVKYSKRRVPLGAWIAQAARQGRDDGRPFVLVVVGHHDRNPIAVVDHAWLVALAQKAGLLTRDLEADDEAPADPRYLYHGQFRSIIRPEALALPEGVAPGGDVHPPLRGGLE